MISKLGVAVLLRHVMFSTLISGSLLVCEFFSVLSQLCSNKISSDVQLVSENGLWAGCQIRVISGPLAGSIFGLISGSLPPDVAAGPRSTNGQYQNSQKIKHNLKSIGASSMRWNIVTLRDTSMTFFNAGFTEGCEIRGPDLVALAGAKRWFSTDNLELVSGIRVQTGQGPYYSLEIDNFIGAEFSWTGVSIVCCGAMIVGSWLSETTSTRVSKIIADCCDLELNDKHIIAAMTELKGVMNIELALEYYVNRRFRGIEFGPGSRVEYRDFMVALFLISSERLATIDFARIMLASPYGDNFFAAILELSVAHPDWKPCASAIALAVRKIVLAVPGGTNILQVTCEKHSIIRNRQTIERCDDYVSFYGFLPKEYLALFSGPEQYFFALNASRANIKERPGNIRTKINVVLDHGWVSTMLGNGFGIDPWKDDRFGIYEIKYYPQILAGCFGENVTKVTLAENCVTIGSKTFLRSSPGLELELEVVCIDNFKPSGPWNSDADSSIAKINAHFFSGYDARILWRSQGAPMFKNAYDAISFMYGILSPIEQQKVRSMMFTYAAKLDPSGSQIAYYFACACAYLMPNALARGIVDITVINGPVYWALMEQLFKYEKPIGPSGIWSIREHCDTEEPPMYPWQADGVKMLLESKRQTMMIWLPPGAGKTRIIFEYFKQSIKQSTMSEYVIFASQPSAIDNLTRQCSRAGFKYRILVRDVNGLDQQFQASSVELLPGIVYFISTADIKVFNTFLNTSPRIAEILPRTTFILDEFHSCLGDSIRGLVAYEIAKAAGFAIPMSGTPFKAGTACSASLANFLSLCVNFQVTRFNYRIVESLAINCKLPAVSKIHRSSKYVQTIDGDNDCASMCTAMLEDVIMDGKPAVICVPVLQAGIEACAYLNARGISHRMMSADEPFSYGPLAIDAPDVIIVPYHQKLVAGYDLNYYQIMYIATFRASLNQRMQLEGRINRSNNIATDIYYRYYYTSRLEDLALTHEMERVDHSGIEDVPITISGATWDVNNENKFFEGDDCLGNAMVIFGLNSLSRGTKIERYELLLNSYANMRAGPCNEDPTRMERLKRMYIYLANHIKNDTSHESPIK